MRQAADRFALLGTLGLSRHQAAAYVALSEYPASTVGELAKVTRIPRNHLYEVLADLQSLGLVDITLAKTRRYTPKPLTDFLEQRVDGLRGKIREIEARRPLLETLFNPTLTEQKDELTSGTTRVLLGRRAVSREVDRLLSNVKREVIAVASKGGLQRMLAYLRGALEGSRRLAKDPQLKVNVIVPPRAVETAAIEVASGLVTGEVFEAAVGHRLNALLVDERELLLIHAIPDDARLSVGEDFALLTTNAALVHDYRALLHIAATPRLVSGHP